MSLRARLWTLAFPFGASTVVADWLGGAAASLIVLLAFALAGGIILAGVRRAERARAEAQAALLKLAGSDAAARGDLDTALAEITEVAAALLGVARCGIWKLSDDEQQLECLDLWAAGRHERGALLLASATPGYFAALRSQRALAVTDALTDARTLEFSDSYLVPNGIRSMLDSPIHVGGRLTAVLCHEHVGGRPRRFSADDQACAASLADCASRVLTESDLARAYLQLGQLARRAEAAKEEERRRIARELHDELGQSLTAVKLSLQLAVKAEGSPSPTRLDEAIAVVDRSIAATRALSRGMRPPLLDEVGLESALRAFVDEQARFSGVTFDLTAPGLGARLPAELEIATFRIVQEAVTNALRHGAPRKVGIRLERDGARVRVVVADDGRGFDVASVLRRAETGAQLGLVGMRERARALGGKFGVSSTPAGGTEVRVEIPTETSGVGA